MSHQRETERDGVGCLLFLSHPTVSPPASLSLHHGSNASSSAWPTRPAPCNTTDVAMSPCSSPGGSRLPRLRATSTPLSSGQVRTAMSPSLVFTCQTKGKHKLKENLCRGCGQKWTARVATARQSLQSGTNGTPSKAGDPGMPPLTPSSVLFFSPFRQLHIDRTLSFSS